MPVLYQTEERAALVAPEEAGNELQQIIIADQVEHLVHVRFPTQRSRDIPVVPHWFGAPFVFECKATLARAGANRQYSVVIFRETEAGQFVLRSDL